MLSRCRSTIRSDADVVPVTTQHSALFERIASMLGMASAQIEPNGIGQATSANEKSTPWLHVDLVDMPFVRQHTRRIAYMLSGSSGQHAELKCLVYSKKWRRSIRTPLLADFATLPCPRPNPSPRHCLDRRCFLHLLSTSPFPIPLSFRLHTPV